MHFLSPIDRPMAARLRPRRIRSARSNHLSSLALLIPAVMLVAGCADQGVSPDPAPVAPSGQVMLGGDLAPPSGDYAEGGYVIPNGFWEGWRVRTHSHDGCGQPMCLRFFDHGSYGSMTDHTQGVYYLGDEPSYEGQVSMQVRFNQGTLGVQGSGRHLFSVTSRPLIFTPRSVGLDDWTRVDFDRPEEGRVRAVVFNIVDGVMIEGGHWPTHWFDVPFEVGRWAEFEVGWEMDGSRLTVRVNGDSHTFDLLPRSEAPGYYIGLGNMDPIQGEIDFRNIRVTAGDPPPPPDPGEWISDRQ
jgi:hypothetical protein